MKDTYQGVKPFNWGIRNNTFYNLAMQGMDPQDAFDIAMCRLHRAEGIDLPWRNPPAALLGSLKTWVERYRPKEEE